MYTDSRNFTSEVMTATAITWSVSWDPVVLFENSSCSNLNSFVSHVATRINFS